MAKSPPSPPAAPVLPQRKASPRSTVPEAVPLDITSGVVDGGDRIVIYGTGGVGKSTLAAWLPNALFLDLERSTKKLDVRRDVVASWGELRGKLATIATSIPQGCRSIVIDSVSVAEELVKEYVIESRRTDKGKTVDSIEGFGWGKGWQYVYDEFVALLADLDRIADQGINICLVAHDVATVVPNPAGDDFLRWEPSVYGGDKRGRANVRSLIKNWSEHVLFVGYDIAVDDGKGRGGGTRTIYTQELPTHVAKSRTRQLSQSFTLDDAGSVWRELGIK